MNKSDRFSILLLVSKLEERAKSLEEIKPDYSRGIREAVSKINQLMIKEGEKNELRNSKN